jgi:hypothetical protein
MDFAKRFLAFEWQQSHGQFVRIPARVFASATQDRSVFRFHINTLNDFKALLADRRMDDHLIDWVQARVYEPFRYDFTIKPEWKAHEWQEPYVDYLAQPVPIAKLLEHQTGKGKSLSAMLACAKVGQRVVEIIKPKYVDKWIEDWCKTFEGFEPTNGSICVVQGSKDLKALLLRAVEGPFDYPVVIISNATYRNWISEYEQYGNETLDLGYACLPEDLFLHLKAGVRLVDETHEDFHFCFKLDTYTHVLSSISLSATLLTKEPLLNRMYDVMFPPDQRMKKLALDKYTEVYNILYRFRNPEKIRTEEYGKTTYSHNALEKSIIRHVPTMRNYFAMIKAVLDAHYIQDKKPGERCLVYAASVDMCTKLTKFLQETYPHLDVRRYVGTEDDPYENAIEPDLCVSTLQSAGTALDIKNLAVVFMTTALDSVQGNIQALGRIRKRDEGEKMRFLFATAENLPKHVKYAEAKKILFQDRAKSFVNSYTGISV